VIDYSRNKRLYRFEKYLTDVGPDTPGAVPALVEAMQYRDIRFKLQAMRALLPLLDHVRGAEVIPVLTENLRSGDGHLLQETILALGRFGPEAAPAVPALVEQLHCQSTNTYEVPPAVIRVQAARALGEIGPAARRAIPDLIVLLQDKSSAVRKAAEQSLKKIADKRSG
jgi:HEAT repeat protein